MSLPWAGHHLVIHDLFSSCRLSASCVIAVLAVYPALAYRILPRGFSCIFSMPPWGFSDPPLLWGVQPRVLHEGSWSPAIWPHRPHYRTTHSFSKHLKIISLSFLLSCLYLPCWILGIVIDFYFFRKRVKSETLTTNPALHILGFMSPMHVKITSVGYLKKFPFILLPGNDSITVKPHGKSKLCDA